MSFDSASFARAGLHDGPGLVDISDLETTKDVVFLAEEERRIIEAERKRLGLKEAVGSHG